MDDGEAVEEWEGRGAQGRGGGGGMTGETGEGDGAGGRARGASGTRAHACDSRRLTTGNHPSSAGQKKHAHCLERRHLIEGGSERSPQQSRGSTQGVHNTDLHIT